VPAFFHFYYNENTVDLQAAQQPLQKNPQTEWSGDVVEHCQQQSNL
jgi:hypothetical protein